MLLTKINNYINPFSTGHCQARHAFADLSRKQKLVTIALTALSSLATLLIGGLGGIAALKALVDAFKVKKIPSENNPTTHKTSQIGNKNLNKSAVNLTRTQKGTIDKTTLSILKLIEECPEIPLLENGCMDETALDHKIGETERKNFEKIIEWTSTASDQQLCAIFNRIKNPDKFCLMATILVREEKTAFETCRILEAVEWPTQDYKNLLLPNLLHELILGAVIWSCVTKYDLHNKTWDLLNIRLSRIFGEGNFVENPQPVSDYLVKVVSARVKDMCSHRINNTPDDYTLSGRMRISIELIDSDKQNFPYSMIEPFALHLQNIHEAVSLCPYDFSEPKVVVKA